jgi:hypothetical protein
MNALRMPEYEKHKICGTKFCRFPSSSSETTRTDGQTRVAPLWVNLCISFINGCEAVRGYFFWCVISFSLVEKHRRFGEDGCSSLQGICINIKPVSVWDLTEIFCCAAVVEDTETLKGHVKSSGLLCPLIRQVMSVEGLMYFYKQLIFYCSSTYNPMSPSVAIHKENNKPHTTSQLTDPISTELESQVWTNFTV